MDQESATAPEAGQGTDREISRRQSMKIGAGIIALAQCLGLPAALLAQGSGAEVQLKYYRTNSEGSRLLYSEPLASPVQEMLMAGGVTELHIKWYLGKGVLADFRLPAEVQNKFERPRG